MAKKKTRRNFSVEERGDLWRRWRKGESLSDIARALQRQPGTIHTYLGEAKAQIEELKKLLATALAANERLAAELKKNSSNSSLPPSSDGPGAVSRGVRESKKPKSERKRGGQKGHRGAHRQLLPLEQVDAFVDLFPSAS